MKKDDIITIEKAIKAAKYCYTMGQIRAERGDAYKAPEAEALFFIGLFGSALNVLGVTDTILETTDCLADEKISLDKVSKNMKIEDMLEFAHYQTSLSIFTNEMIKGGEDELQK